MADLQRTDVAFAVLLVNGTSHALCAEKALQRAGIRCKLIPVPRHLSSDCGVCLRVERTDGEAASRVLAAATVEVLAIHPV